MKIERNPQSIKEVKDPNITFDSIVANPGRRKFLMLATMVIAGALIPGCGYKNDEPPPPRLRDKLKNLPGLPGTN